MIRAYPIILTPDEIGYSVTIPDINCGTEGRDIADAIFKARNVLGMWAIAEQDKGRRVPEPSLSPPQCAKNDIVTYVDINIYEFRQRIDMTIERTNITLPRYLKNKAKAAGINFSQELQERLKERLKIQAVSGEE